MARKLPTREEIIVAVPWSVAAQMFRDFKAPELTEPRTLEYIQETKPFTKRDVRRALKALKTVSKEIR